MNHYFGLAKWFLVSFLISSCTRELDQVEHLFLLQPAQSTHINFVNQLYSTEAFNTYTFRNFYNGAGVGIGDINNDGWTDLFFCGNTVDNRLYLNKGNFEFEDITEKAGVASKSVWSTGVSFADINGDGWLDIYVCKSGPPGGTLRYNELFINNGDATFTEAAKEWGIADEGLSVHAAFFDYDKDGDLDMYLLNNSLRSIGTGSDLMENNRNIRDPNGGNKFYKNEGDHFVDASEAVGIFSSKIGFGLGVTIGDVNRDGWQDIYVSNDFFEKDYLYINQKDGTFNEELESWIREISMGSMGADLADLNNDAYPEIFVTEMLPASNARYKTKAQFENWNTYQRQVDKGYYHQFGRNVLQLNNGDGTFSEIGRLAGVEASDWSWGALIFDMDADGWKDIFIANGIYKDLLDQDYVNFYSNPERVREIIRTEKEAILKLIDKMPSQAVPNCAYQNKGGIEFQDQATSWGLDTPGFSNGAAYGDLDNDGDLDLVVSNVNMPPFLYKSLAKEQLHSNTLSIQLKGENKNQFGLGAQVSLFAKDQVWYQELAPMRGFQSCVDYRMVFGLGVVNQLDSIKVVWNSGKISVLENVAANQLVEIEEKVSLQRKYPEFSQRTTPAVFKKASQSPVFRHQENLFSDFDRDRLLFQMLSAEGPEMAKGDVNGDGLEDFYISGAKDQSGALFIQQKNGGFTSSNEALFEKDKISEDSDALFFDADGDKDLDLYVASGGNEFPESSTALVDRLYINDGKGLFSKSEQILPTFKFESTGCVKACDFDQDGDQDLFIGIRLRPFQYGIPANGYLLENDGSGKFRDITQLVAPELTSLGMITDALWMDIDGDRDFDLVVAGEWMPVTVFVHEKGRWVKDKEQKVFPALSGWWTRLIAADMDKDGDMDFIAGNHGLNSRFSASPERPVQMYINDFDGNRSIEQIVTTFSEDKAYPIVLRTDLVTQLPELKKKYLNFSDYQDQTIEDIFPKEILEKSIVLKADELRTTLFENEGNGHFKVVDLPVQTQFSPVYGIAVEDFDQDGHKDLLLGGNFYRSKPEVGIYDATYGIFLKGDGKLGFSWVRASDSGICIKGEIRDFEILHGNRLLVSKNNDFLEMYNY